MEATEHLTLTSTRPVTNKDNHQNFYTRLLVPGEKYPEEFRDLRKKVYVDEFGKIDQPFDGNDEACSVLLAYSKGKLVGSVSFGAAEDTDFGKWSNRSRANLEKSVLITRGTVLPEYRGQGIYKYLIYEALSYYRAQGRKRVVSYSEEGNTAIKKLIDDWILSGSQLRNVGAYNVECIEADISYVMWKLFTWSPPAMQTLLMQNVAIAEIERFSKNKIKDFYKCDFFRSVVEKTLTKRQYIEVMANTYCYVQWTTRILAGLFGSTGDESIHKEIASHLLEEIGHPDMVINDIRVCGGSDNYIDYVKKGMVANCRIDAFMSTQEAAVSFRRDPIAFLGVPIGIEGITAYMPPEFVSSLKELAAAWGIKEPGKATTFWASHVVFDNPENGHWARIIGLVRQHLRNEVQVRQILNYVENVVTNVGAGYSASIPEVIS